MEKDNMPLKLMCSFYILIFYVSVVNCYWSKDLSHRHQNKHKNYFNKHLYQNVYNKKYETSNEESVKKSRFILLDKLLTSLIEPSPSSFTSTTNSPLDDGIVDNKYSFTENSFFTENLNSLEVEETVPQQNDNYLIKQQVGGDKYQLTNDLSSKLQLSNQNNRLIDITTNSSTSRVNRTELNRRRPSFSIFAGQHQYAMQHIMRMSNESACKVPRPKLIKVKDVYPHSSKNYLPACTILNRCGDDSGCCEVETKVCKPAKMHQVELYFVTTTLGNSESSVEKLTFFNHTECECKDRVVEQMARDRPYDTKEVKDGADCRCPSQFTVRQLSNTTCICDCFDKQKECLRLKRGRSYFNVQDKLCIETKQCLLPRCEFGSYMGNFSRCPKKQEKFSNWQTFSLNHHTPLEQRTAVNSIA